MSKKIVRFIKDMTDFSSNWTAENGDFGNVGKEVREFVNGEWIPLASGGGESDYPNINNDDGYIDITGSATKNVTTNLNLGKLSDWLNNQISVTESIYDPEPSVILSPGVETELKEYTVKETGVHIINGHLTLSKGSGPIKHIKVWLTSQTSNMPHLNPFFKTTTFLTDGALGLTELVIPINLSGYYKAGDKFTFYATIDNDDETTEKNVFLTMQYQTLKVSGV